MSVPAEIMDLYSQYDFIPDEIYRGWAEAGFPIGASLEWLMVPQGLANAYLTALGTDASAHMGAISSVAISEHEDIIRSPTLLGEMVTPVLRGKLRQVLLCCRIVVGVIRPPPEPAPAASAYPPTFAPNIIVQPPPAKEEPDPMLQVAVNDVARQGSEAKVTRMSNTEFQDARENYRKKEGDYPPYGQQPTIEQCTVFMMFIIKHCVLYMDFAIWVPNGDRALMRRHFTSRQLDSKGNFTYVEVYGPPNFREWTACWRVFAAACIMFDIVSSGMLTRYYNLIEELVNRCPDAWGVIYQADVRTRNEHFPRVLAEVLAHHAKKVAKGKGDQSGVDPSKPWDAVFRRICGKEEKSWWYDIIEIPFQSLVPGAAKVDKFIDGDVLVRPDAHSRGPAPGADVPAPPPPSAPSGYKLVKIGGSEDRRAQPDKRQQTGGNHPQSRNGVYITTRNGRPVCDGFNTGACRDCDSWGRCSKDQASAHQCHLCLMVGHGAHESNLCPKQGGGKGGGKPKAAPKTQGAPPRGGARGRKRNRP